MATTLEQKKSYLDALAVGYYVVGGLAALMACFALIYIGLGAFMMHDPGAFQPEAPPPFVGWLIVGIGLFCLVLGWGFAGTMIAAGRAISRRRKWTFALVMAVVACLFAPLGTILGIFAILLLVQPEVKALFEGQPPAAE